MLPSKTVRWAGLISPGIYPQYSGKARGGSLSESTGAETTGILRETYDPEFKRLLQANLEMMKALKEKKIEIPWYGKGGIDEKMKKQQNTNVRYQQDHEPENNYRREGSRFACRHGSLSQITQLFLRRPG